jgi:hypothetical protein
MKKLTLLVCLFSFATHFAHADVEFDPFAPNAEELLNEFDVIYEMETGESAHIDDGLSELAQTAGCSRLECPVWARVNKATQTLALYLNGNPQPLAVWPVSTGLPGHGTPNFDKHPDGRIYNRYTSTKFPGGDYKGLGNMPYAVFIKGGFAIHGTPAGNWPKLGRKASHGCIRVHPDNAHYFNQLVRAEGVRNVWITVE